MKFVLIKKEREHFVVEAEGYEPLLFSDVLSLKKGVFYLQTQQKIKAIIHSDCATKEIERALRQLKCPFSVVRESIFQVIKQLF